MTDQHLGPAMLVLSEQERDFVYALVVEGGNASKAAAAAGYGDDSGTPEQKKNAARVAGYRLSHRQTVINAIREEAERRLHSGALIAASVLIEIATNSTHKDQFKAAKELLGHSGLNVVTEHKVTVEHTPSDQEKIARIIRMANALGMDPRALLGQAGVVVDAEFKVVDTGMKQLVGPISSAAGLEDLL